MIFACVALLALKTNRKRRNKSHMKMNRTKLKVNILSMCVCLCMAKSNCGFMMQAIKSYWNVVDFERQLYGNQHRNWNLKIQIFLCGQKRLTYIFETYLIYRSVQCVVSYVVLWSIASNRRFGSHWCVVLVLCFVSMQRVFIAISWNEHFLMQ